MITIGVLLIVALLLFIAKMMWRLGSDEQTEWTKDDQGAYEVRCAWERES